ncbi:MAG TPA: hypothetical protein PKA37_09170 [Planctomycetota bacterium]|nr:hypothetical protein [Planctomycetota bacterium]
MSESTPLSTDGFRLAEDSVLVTRLDGVLAEPDGEAWGFLPMAEVQRRLEEADDFAVLQLFADLHLGSHVERLYVEVNDEGIRTLDLKGTYGVPVRGVDLAPDQVRYLIEKALAPGVHRLIWSYAWNPPKDSSGAPISGGVTLTPLRVLHLWANEKGELRTIDDEIDVRALVGASGTFVRSVQIRKGSRCLRVEATPPGSVIPMLGNVCLPAVGDELGMFALGDGVDGEQVLGLHFDATCERLRSLSWDR